MLAVCFHKFSCIRGLVCSQITHMQSVLFLLTCSIQYEIANQMKTNKCLKFAPKLFATIDNLYKENKQSLLVGCDVLQENLL